MCKITKFLRGRLDTKVKRVLKTLMLGITTAEKVLFENTSETLVQDPTHWVES